MGSVCPHLKDMSQFGLHSSHDRSRFASESFETAENSCYCRSLLIQNVSILLVIIESLKVKVSFFIEKENAHGAYFFSDVAIETLLDLSFFLGSGQIPSKSRKSQKMKGGTSNCANLFPTRLRRIC